MQRYNPKTIEPKWQKTWADTRLYEVTEDSDKPKIYATPMLPYPSGAGLHVGHCFNYSIADAVARFHRQRGFNVMTNMGWDAFGLPTENYAIKTGISPQQATKDNVARFKEQLSRLGMSYDWSRELNTTEPEYYKWTQWIFAELFKEGLAYQGESQQWWCTKCKTVLANEQVENNKCWRHDKPEDPEVERRTTKQWFFKITDYADELLEHIDELDWPDGIKESQRNWIGRSVGAEIDFAVAKSENREKSAASNELHDTNCQIRVFTTRPDTLYGATYLVLAPEHELVSKITTNEQKQEVEKYVHEAKSKTDLQRKKDEKQKTGVFTGAYAINPINNEKIPIWIADYVLMGYGTGAIMAVPAHDERDHEFADKFKLKIVETYKKADPEESKFGGEGVVINSGEFDGLRTEDAREKIVAKLADDKKAQEKVNYRMRDWLISRQRYWGAPIPIIHCDACGPVAVPEQDLPVVLPEVESYQPTDDGQTALASVEDWVNVECPTCNKPAKRETDTMDGYACSSWYMYRYTDSKNTTAAFSKEAADYWFPVDFYFGGDHAVSHLLYFRFWNKFFADKGYIDSQTREPVKKLVYNGYINAADGRKMSKSLGNVVDPLEVIDSGYGADALRTYMLFIGPYDQDAVWNPNGVPGTYRFLNRVWDFVQEFMEARPADPGKDVSDLETAVASSTHRAIKKVTEDLKNLSFNTAIAAQMKLSNELRELQKELPFGHAPRTWMHAIESTLRLLAPFAPHMTEELWQSFGHNTESIHIGGWPEWDDELVKEELITVVVQINGKVRANITMSAEATEEEMVQAAKEDTKIAEYLESGELKKTITVPGRLVNFVVEG
ncbi:TPA: leucine--tRNA ligase [Candidatus Saccharibacteria bacterium]|nr:leucine--tRNA ligase [Candidatus Saccharibacteria bacterium]HIO87508.1 leucine--tRNA ligase [Candidatus Saccharibacteria bacterium]